MKTILKSDDEQSRPEKPSNPTPEELRRQRYNALDKSTEVMNGVLAKVPAVVAAYAEKLIHEPVSFTVAELSERLDLPERYLRSILKRGDALVATETDGLIVTTEANLIDFQKRKKEATDFVNRAIADGQSIQRKLILDGAGVDDETATRLGF